MIELKNVSKVFKSKNNKIIAINNTSLILNKGLVALLGPSGCGKTTLLNVIGGLDKVGNGKIYINNTLYKRVSKIDEIRNLEIGYIFQDYKLINEMTVFDNVAIVLKMLGIKNKNEIRERVEYVLSKVGMLRYRKRPASMLSGGERQRVAIARAIVKNPDIILADEPTGNLDSKNSLEIMKIISAIAKEKLVVMVTHEQNLAKFYANRIIEIKDGNIINDYENFHNNGLDYKIDNNIYLKDFSFIKRIKEDNIDFNIYSENETINMDIIFKNNNIYIKSSKKIEVIDEFSNIELIDDNYKVLEKETLNEYDFNIKDMKKKYTSIFKFLNFISFGFKKVFGYSILKKLLLGGFFIASMFVMFAFSSYVGVNTHDKEEFLTADENYVLSNFSNLSFNDFNEILNNENIEYAVLNNSIVDININVREYYQISNYFRTSTSLSAREIEEEDLIYGRQSLNSKEVVIDKFVVDKILNQNMEIKNLGIFEPVDIINKQFENSLGEVYTIVGMVDFKNPCLYTTEEEINHLYNSLNYQISMMDYTKVNIELVDGRYPLDEEVILHEMMSETEEIKINGISYKVVGYYNSDLLSFPLTTERTLLHNFTTTNKRIIFSTFNKEALIADLKDMDINSYDYFDYSKEIYERDMSNMLLTILAVSIIALSVSLIEIFIISRSSFMSRIKEVGIYRAIGIKKIDIYKMFSGEIIAITTLASVPGIIFMSYILYNIKSLDSFFEVNIITFIGTIIFIYLFNLIIGLIPVFATIIKYPAAILTKNNVE